MIYVCAIITSFRSLSQIINLYIYIYIYICVCVCIIYYIYVYKRNYINILYIFKIYDILYSILYSY